MNGKFPRARLRTVARLLAATLILTALWTSLALAEKNLSSPLGAPPTTIVSPSPAAPEAAGELTDAAPGPDAAGEPADTAPDTPASTGAGQPGVIYAPSTDEVAQTSSSPQTPLPGDTPQNLSEHAEPTDKSAASPSSLTPANSEAALPRTNLAVEAGQLTVEGGVQDIDWAYQNKTLTIKTPLPLVISGTSTRDKVVVQSGLSANITLRNLSIAFNDGAGIDDGTCAFNMNGAVVNLTLEGANSLKSGVNMAGLRVTGTAALTINGSGSLEASGGTFGAGVGGGAQQAVGSITLLSGSVHATGGGEAAGIGSGWYGDSSHSAINITGGSVRAKGGIFAAGIGGGNNSDGGTISISGGVVNATGRGSISEASPAGSGGAGIGAGGHHVSGAISITGGQISATGGTFGGAGIGGSTGFGSGIISIIGGTVSASGTDGGAGIGWGKGGSGGTFKTTEAGSPFISTNSITDLSRKEYWSGVIMLGSTGQVYGNPLLSTSATIPAGSTLVVAEGRTLSVGNNVNLVNDGAIENHGAIVKVDSGDITGAGTLTSDSSLDLSFDSNPAPYGTSVLITAQVSQSASTSWGPAVASGSVAFKLGSEDVGSAPLLADGSGGARATFEITPQAWGTAHWVLGTNQVSAIFAGSAGLSPAQGSSTLEVTGGTQVAPTLTPTGESVQGRADGTMGGLTSAMEYATNEAGPYTSVTEANMPFSAGTYWVRLAADANLLASPSTPVTVAAGPKAHIALPDTQAGYSLSVDKPDISWTESATLSFVLNGGVKNPNFSVKLNGVPVELQDNKFTITHPDAPILNVTVEGLTQSFAWIYSTDGVPEGACKIVGWNGVQPEGGIAAVPAVNEGLKVIRIEGVGWNNPPSPYTGLAASLDCSQATNLDVVGDYAFNQCTGLTGSLALPAATTIGWGAFNQCTGLTGSLSLPAATTIGQDAFFHCTGLTSLSLPVATTLGQSAFADCTGLTGSLSLPAATILHSRAFFCCTGLTSISLPMATSVGSAFYGCKGLTSISLPSVTSVASYAFKNCEKLTSISLPAATSVGNTAFQNCALTSVELGEHLAFLDDGAFDENSLWHLSGLPASCTVGAGAMPLGDQHTSTPVIWVDDPDDPSRVRVLLQDDLSAHGVPLDEVASVNLQLPAPLTPPMFVMPLPSPIEPLNDWRTDGWVSFPKDKVQSENAHLVYEWCHAVSSPDGAMPVLGKMTMPLQQKPSFAWTYSTDGMPEGTCEIVGWNDVQPESGIAVVPAEHNGLKVTRIARGGQFSSYKLLSASLDFSQATNLAVIDIQAFDGCTKLSGPLAISSPIDIGTNAFNECSGLTSVSLPAVTSVAEGAFYNCSGLADISLPAVTSLGTASFYGCTKLTSLSLPATTLGESAFYQCTGLTSVSLSTATSIDYNAFSGCTNLISLSLPAVISVGANAFSNCTSLTSLSLPDAITVSGSAFYNCTNLTEALLPSTTSVGNYAFEKCTNLVSLSLPAVITIGANAFNSCTSLTKALLPAATSVDSGAFQNCTNLTEASLLAATSVGSDAFNSCSGLTSVSLPVVASVGSSAFQNCEKLTTISLPAATSVGNTAFQNCALTSAELGEHLAFLGKESFGKNSLWHLSGLPASCTVDAGAMPLSDQHTSTSTLWIDDPNDSSRVRVLLQDDLSAHGVPLDEVASVNLQLPAPLTPPMFVMPPPSPLEPLNDWRTDGWVSFPKDKVCSDGAHLVYEWRHAVSSPDGTMPVLGKMTMPLERKPFAWIYSTDGMPEGACKIVGWNGVQPEGGIAAVPAVNEGLKVTKIVNERASSPYQLLSASLDFSEASNLDEIGYAAFINCTNLSGSLSIPFCVSVGTTAFRECTGLTSLSLPSATSLGEGAFYNCSGLAEISLPAVTSLGTATFYGCTSLTSLSLPATTLGESAFYHCTGLTSLSLPAATSIGPQAFIGCTGLTSVSLPATTEIDLGAFYSCTGLTSVSLPAATQIGPHTFGQCALDSVELGANLAFVGESAFANNHLAHLELPANPALDAPYDAAAHTGVGPNVMGAQSRSEIAYYIPVGQSEGEVELDGIADLGVDFSCIPSLAISTALNQGPTNPAWRDTHRARFPFANLSESAKLTYTYTVSRTGGNGQALSTGSVSVGLGAGAEYRLRVYRVAGTTGAFDELSQYLYPGQSPDAGADNSFGFVRAGYHVPSDGWTDGASQPVTLTNQVAAPGQVYSYYNHWAGNTYTLAFNDGFEHMVGLEAHLGMEGQAGGPATPNPAYVYGSVNPRTDLVYGDTYTLPDLTDPHNFFVMGAYRFVGWATDANLDETERREGVNFFLPGAALASPLPAPNNNAVLTLYAQWSAVSLAEPDQIVTFVTIPKHIKLMSYGGYLWSDAEGLSSPSDSHAINITTAPIRPGTYWPADRPTIAVSVVPDTPGEPLLVLTNRLDATPHTIDVLAEPNGAPYDPAPLTPGGSPNPLITLQPTTQGPDGPTSGSFYLKSHDPVQNFVPGTYSGVMTFRID